MDLEREGSGEEGGVKEEVEGRNTTEKGKKDERDERKNKRGKKEKGKEKGEANAVHGNEGK